MKKNLTSIWLLSTISISGMESNYYNLDITTQNFKQAVETYDIDTVRQLYRNIKDAPDNMKKIYIKEIDFNSLNSINRKQIIEFKKANDPAAKRANMATGLFCITVGIGALFHEIAGEYGAPRLISDKEAMAVYIVGVVVGGINLLAASLNGSSKPGEIGYYLGKLENIKKELTSQEVEFKNV